MTLGAMSVFHELTFERWVMSHNEDENLLRAALLDLKDLASR
jgi:hypothetical protein